jgi:molybdopterin converting factor small subunit
MPQVRVLLFGLGDKAAGKTKLVQQVGPDATVEELWLSLPVSAADAGTNGHVERRALLVLVNGEPIEYLDGWSTRLSDNDQVTYLRKAVGG